MFGCKKVDMEDDKIVFIAVTYGKVLLRILFSFCLILEVVDLA